jgi:hypothetical protein
MKNYHLLLLLFACIAISSCHEMTSEECQSKYTLVPGPCPPVPPTPACDLGSVITVPPDNTPSGFKKATEAEAQTLKTNYNPATGMLKGLGISKNALTYLLCTMQATDTIFFDFAKDGANYTYVVGYKKSSGEMGWIYRDPTDPTGGQSICPPHCSRP